MLHKQFTIHGNSRLQRPAACPRDSCVTRAGCREVRAITAGRIRNHASSHARAIEKHFGRLHSTKASEPSAMGQYWKILNVDKGTGLHNPAGMRLPELLMNKRAEPLIDLLNVPRLYKVLLPPLGLAGKKARFVDEVLRCGPESAADTRLGHPALWSACRRR